MSPPPADRLFRNTTNIIRMKSKNPPIMYVIDISKNIITPALIWDGGRKERVLGVLYYNIPGLSNPIITVISDISTPDSPKAEAFSLETTCLIPKE